MMFDYVLVNVAGCLSIVTMSAHGSQLRRKPRSSFAALNSPKPFSFGPKSSKLKSVHFERRDEGNIDKSTSQTLVKSGSEVNEGVLNVCDNGGSKTKEVYETPIQPSSHSVPLQTEVSSLTFHDESTVKHVQKRNNDSNQQAYVDLADFLRQIDLGTSTNSGKVSHSERQYTDDDLDEVLLDKTSHGSERTDTVVNEHITPKVIEKPAVHYSTDGVNYITRLVERPGEEDFVCPPLPPPPSEEDLATYNAEVSPRTESTPSPPGIFSPTYKAAATFNVWSPSGGSEFANGVNAAQVSEKPLSTSIPSGFRSVARPVLKKPDKGPITSSVTTSYQIPGHNVPQSSDNIRFTPNHELPAGAVYETQTIDGNVLHTDTYYPAPGESTILERTKKTTVIKAEHHHGMGPTDEQGVPVALRSTVDNPKAWYKNMFKQIHKVDEEDMTEHSNHSADSPIQDERPIISQTPMYKPKKLGRITDYTPSEPYVVENKPQEKIPTASTSYRPQPEQFKKTEMNTTSDEPVHGREYAVKDYPLADYVVSEPKQVVNSHPPKPKESKPQGKKQTARVKYDFNAQSGKQLGLKKDQFVVITREVNKDWYEGETTDGKKSGIFPSAYVEVLNTYEKKRLKKGIATAKFNFNGTSPKQLSVKKGDKIELIEKVDQNWYKACIGQRNGIVPANYLEVEQEPEKPKKDGQNLPIAKPKNQEQASTKAPDFSQYFHNASSSTSSSNNEPDEKEKMSKASFLAHAVVNSGAHLSMPQARRGEFDIPELDDASMGISRGVNGNERHVLHGSNNTSASQRQKDYTQDNQVANPRRDYPPNDHIAAKPSTNSVSSTKSSDGVSEPSLADDDFAVNREKHLALYQYVPQNEDELELLQGDFVQVVEKCDDGWFVGTCERTGAFGTFPGNYVAKIE